MKKSLFLIVALAASTCFAQTTQIRVKVETVSNLGLAPVIAGFSDGSWDIFDVGSKASSALEDLAETGSPAGFAPPKGGPVFGDNPAPGPPIFRPGTMGEQVFTVSNTNNRFNLAAMLLPSNDWFVGNDSGLDVSSLLGGAIGTSLSLDLNTVYDAGTETEDFAASPGNPIIGVTTMGSGASGVGTDQDGVVSMVSITDPFGSFANKTPAGLNTTQFDFANTTIARVTLTTVPEPGTGVLALAGLALFPLLRRRRR